MAAGRQVPIILLPRFSTVVGPTVYSGLPVETSAFQKLRLQMWRGVLIGASTTFGISVEESTDRDTWSQILSPADPGENTEATVFLTLTRPWVRARMWLTGSGAGATCWAQGFLERRERSIPR